VAVVAAAAVDVVDSVTVVDVVVDVAVAAVDVVDSVTVVAAVALVVAVEDLPTVVVSVISRARR
jgi:hypothetical protein